MRTNRQGVKRYFSAIWAAYGSVIVVVGVLGATVEVPVVDVALAVGAALLSVIGVVLGIIHGATAMHARQLDENDITRESYYGKEDHDFGFDYVD